MIPPEETLVWRIETLERELREERKTRHDSVERINDKKADVEDLKTLAEEVHGLRRALVLFSLSMIGSAFAFIVGVLAIIQTP